MRFYFHNTQMWTRTFIVIVLLFTARSVQSQDRPLRGLILGENDSTLANVTILVTDRSGTDNKTTWISNQSGRFEISNISPSRTYDISFTHSGYQQYDMKGFEIKPGENNSLLIRMTRATNALSEVVVVGYGSQRRRDITSSISSVKGSQIKNFPVSSFTEALTGQVPGVQISQVSGEPGRAVNVRVRGTGSISAGNNPLYVVDGFPVDVESFSTINPSDIESIEILKDASATSIYGSRGANGVVMVTTKRGKSGTPAVQFNTYRGIQQLSKKVDVLSPEEYVDLAVEAIQNSWIERGGNANDPNSARPALYQISPYFLDPQQWTRTDWQDEIYRSAQIADYNVSVAGGTEKTRYMTSFGFFDQQGIIHNTGFKRYAVRLNLDADISKRIRFSLNFAPSYSVRNTVLSSGRWNQGAVGAALALPGFFPVQNEDGTYPSFDGFGFNSSAVFNPVSMVNEANGQDRILRLITNANVTVDLFKGFSYKLNAGIDYNTEESSFYRTTRLSQGLNPGGNASTAFNNNVAIENTFTYIPELSGDHGLNFLLGQSAQFAEYSNSNLSAINYPNDFVSTLNAGQINGGGTTRSEWALASYFFRLNYSFREKFFVNAAIRTDGSSRFGADRKWGQFPSISAGWLISEEEFLRNSSAISQLKLRASYGITGNNFISNYGSIGLLSGTNYVFGNRLVNGQFQRSLSNLNLGWENAKMFDIGIDLSLFNNRLTVVYDFYDKINEDLLLDVPVPSITGNTTTLMNIGRVRNRGMEFGITSHNLTGKFSWTTSLNVSFNRNKVLALGPNGDPIITTGMATMQGTHITQVGSPIGSYYGFIFDGIYNSMDEIEKRPHLATDRPGDPIIRDVNGDGQIGMDDRAIIGNNFPDYIFGLDNNFRFGNFDLRILLHGVQGLEIMNLTKHGIGILHGRLNQLGEARERWRSPENPGNGEVFRASLDINGYRRLSSTHYVEDASFVRLKNVSIGYTLPRRFMERLKFSGARIFVTGQNLVTWTKYPMYNPEASQASYNDPLTPGSDMDVYPLARIFTAGINVNF